MCRTPGFERFWKPAPMRRATKFEVPQHNSSRVDAQRVLPSKRYFSKRPPPNRTCEFSRVYGSPGGTKTHTQQTLWDLIWRHFRSFGGLYSLVPSTRVVFSSVQWTGSSAFRVARFSFRVHLPVSTSPRGTAFPALRLLLELRDHRDSRPRRPSHIPFVRETCLESRRCPRSQPSQESFSRALSRPPFRTWARHNVPYFSGVGFHMWSPFIVRLPVGRRQNLSTTWVFPRAIIYTAGHWASGSFSVHHRIQLLRSLLAYPASAVLRFHTKLLSPSGLFPLRWGSEFGGDYVGDLPPACSTRNSRTPWYGRTRAHMLTTPRGFQIRLKADCLSHSPPTPYLFLLNLMRDTEHTGHTGRDRDIQSSDFIITLFGF